MVGATVGEVAIAGCLLLVEFVRIFATVFDKAGFFGVGYVGWVLVWAGDPAVTYEEAGEVPLFFCESVAVENRGGDVGDVLAGVGFACDVDLMLSLVLVAGCFPD